jgi:hypothetical protein
MKKADQKRDKHDSSIYSVSKDNVNQCEAIEEQKQARMCRKKLDCIEGIDLFELPNSVGHHPSDIYWADDLVVHGLQDPRVYNV